MAHRKTLLKPKHRISQTAQQVIAERKQAARPRALGELSALVKCRGGAMTDRQLDIVASVISYIVPPDSMPGAMESWLVAMGASEPNVEHYFESVDWSKVLHRAFSAQCGGEKILRPFNSSNGDESGEIVDPRRDYSLQRIVQEFAITENDQKLFGLTLLVSERQRSAARRRAEGVPLAGERKKIEPWKQAGLSRATFYRRRAAADKLAKARLLETVTSIPEFEPDTPTLDKPVSYSESFDYVTVAANLIRHVEPRQPAEPYRGTAEARRLAALAGRLGLVWEGQSQRNVRYWFTCPQDVVLTSDEADELFAAEAATRDAEARRDAIEGARSKAAYIAARRTPEMRAAAWAAEQAERAAQAAAEAEQAAARMRGDQPRWAPVHLWNAVPEELRSRARDCAARFVVFGHPVDLAIVYAVVQVRREDALVAAVRRLDGSADMERVAFRVQHMQAWRCPTERAAADIISTLAQQDEARRLAEQQVAKAMADAKPPVPDADYATILSDATDILANGPHNGAKHSVQLARDILHAKRNPPSKQGYYRNYS